VEEHLRMSEGLVLEENARVVVDVLLKVVVCGVDRGGDDGRWLRSRREAMKMKFCNKRAMMMRKK